MRQAFDARRLHRVHALGVSIRGRAALALLPMGGGKSTLGWQLLNYPGVELLSDDSPLIDAEGKVHAFPLRLGLLPGSDPIVPERQLRRINRMEFGPKLLVNYSYFADRVRPSAEPCLLLLGKRSLSRSCSIEPAGSAAALRALLSNCIVGMGLFQGMEFVFQRSAKEIAFKAVIASHRLRASLNLIRRSKTFHLLLGRDPVENGRVVHDFLDRHARD